MGEREDFLLRQQQETQEPIVTIPPKGFRSQLFPLRHRFVYSFGLSAISETENSTICTLVKNYKQANAPTVVDVNPHHASFDRETGAICNPMSIIDKLNLKLDFNMVSEPSTDILKVLKFSWTPIFFSFGEKLDAADDFTTLTVKAILGLTSEATAEDVTPLYTNTNLTPTGPSDKDHPASTVNFTEVFGTADLDTDMKMEAVAFDNTILSDARAYYTNKGALNACIGQTRHVTLTEHMRHKGYFIKKFVPRAIRRIMPYSFFGLLVHVPITADIEQAYHGAALTADTPHLGVKIICRYHEWHSDHNQDMTG